MICNYVKEKHWSLNTILCCICESLHIRAFNFECHGAYFMQNQPVFAKLWPFLSFKNYPEKNKDKKTQKIMSLVLNWRISLS